MAKVAESKREMKTKRGKDSHGVLLRALGRSNRLSRNVLGGVIELWIPNGKSEFA